MSKSKRLWKETSSSLRIFWNFAKIFLNKKVRWKKPFSEKKSTLVLWVKKILLYSHYILQNHEFWQFFRDRSWHIARRDLKIEPASKLKFLLNTNFWKFEKIFPSRWDIAIQSVEIDLPTWGDRWFPLIFFKILK